MLVKGAVSGEMKMEKQKTELCKCRR